MEVAPFYSTYDLTFFGNASLTKNEASGEIHATIPIIIPSFLHKRGVMMIEKIEVTLNTPILGHRNNGFFFLYDETHKKMVVLPSTSLSIATELPFESISPYSDRSAPKMHQMASGLLGVENDYGLLDKTNTRRTINALDHSLEQLVTDEDLFKIKPGPPKQIISIEAICPDCKCVGSYIFQPSGIVTVPIHSTNSNCSSGGHLPFPASNDPHIGKLGKLICRTLNLKWTYITSLIEESMDVNIPGYVKSSHVGTIPVGHNSSIVIYPTFVKDIIGIWSWINTLGYTVIPGHTKRLTLTAVTHTVHTNGNMCPIQLQGKLSIKQFFSKTPCDVSSLIKDHDITINTPPSTTLLTPQMITRCMIVPR